MELDSNPESTWGQTEEYKAAWHAKYGNVSPKASAPKAEWVEFAAKNGMSEEEAEASTREALVERFGAGTLQSGTSAPNDNIVGQGSGTGPSPSAADPAVQTATTGRTAR